VAEEPAVLLAELLGLLNHAEALAGLGRDNDLRDRDGTPVSKGKR
jgi:hypothetical protein